MSARFHRPGPLSALASSVCVLAALSLTSCSRTIPNAPLSDAGATGSSRVATTSDLDGGPEELLVLLAPGADAGQIALDYNSQLVSVEQGYAVYRPQPGQLLDVMLTRAVSDSRIVTAEQNADLMLAESRQRSFTFDDGRGELGTYLRQPAEESISLYAAHYAGNGDGVRVAFLDTGIDPTHPAFAGRIVNGRDLVDHDPIPTDEKASVDSNHDGVLDGAYGHGTHIAGIISLVAPAAVLMPVRVLDSDGVGEVSAVAAGIRWAVANGADVINMSLGMFRTSPAIRQALKEARERGVVCVSSAGNWGAETPAEYPAVSPDVIAVAAVDAEAKPPAWTSYGSFVGLCAPGVAVRSAYPGAVYQLWSGTSMSAAFVSGTAALLRAQHPDWGTPEVMTRLAKSARPVAADAILASKLGAGALDAGAALGLDLPGGFMDPRSDLNAYTRSK